MPATPQMTTQQYVLHTIRQRQELLDEIERLRAALREMVYETTHLSLERDDGSHVCRISRKALQRAREALGPQQDDQS